MTRALFSISCAVHLCHDRRVFLAPKKKLAPPRAEPDRPAPARPPPPTTTTTSSSSSSSTTTTVLHAKTANGKAPNFVTSKSQIFSYRQKKAGKKKRAIGSAAEGGGGGGQNFWGSKISRIGGFAQPQPQKFGSFTDIQKTSGGKARTKIPTMPGHKTAVWYAWKHHERRGKGGGAQGGANVGADAGTDEPMPKPMLEPMSVRARPRFPLASMPAQSASASSREWGQPSRAH